MVNGGPVAGGAQGGATEPQEDGAEAHRTRDRKEAAEGLLEPKWRIYGGFMKDLWKIYGGFMEDLWKIYERFMEGLWRIYERFMEGLLMRLAADSLLSRWQLYFAFCMNLYELDFLRVFRCSAFFQVSSFASHSRAWATDMSFMSQSAFLCIGGFMEDL